MRSEKKKEGNRYPLLFVSRVLESGLVFVIQAFKSLVDRA